MFARSLYFDKILLLLYVKLLILFRFSRKAQKRLQGIMILKQSIHKFHSVILSACPMKNLPNIEDLGKPLAGRTPQPMMVPTAAALKMGVGFPLKNIPSGRADRVLSSHANKGKYLFIIFLQKNN